MRRLWRWTRTRKRTVFVPEPLGLASVLMQAPGKWVAVDRATNEPRLIAASPYELAAEIRQRNLKNIAVVRAPDPSEPELVGLG